MMGREGGFIAIILVDFYLPVPTVHVKRGEDCGIRERIDVFVHAGYAVRLLLGNCIPFSIVEAETKGAILLGGECYW